MLPHRGPVDAVHPAVVEIVALEAPGIDELLTPFVARIEVQYPVLEVDLCLGEVGWRLRAGVDDVDVVPAPHENLLAVERQLVAADVGHERLGLRVLVLDREAHELRPGGKPGVPRQEVQSLAVRAE